MPQSRLGEERLISLAKRLILLPRSLRLKLVRLEGVLKFEKFPFSLVYIGEGESLEYLKSLYFQEVRQEKTLNFPLWALREKIREIKDDDIFLCVEINRLFDFLIPASGFLTFPWIRQKVFLKSDIFLKRRGYIEGNYGRKVRKYRYTMGIVRDRGSAEKFYRDFYLPYMENKYKDLIHPRRFKEFLGILRSGFLLQVLEEGRWVSGIICQKKARDVTAFAFGVLPDYEEHLRRGVLSAAYYFLFQWAQVNRMETIDLLRSRPHSLDGVYEHKRRWGAEPQDDGWSHVSIRIFPSHEGRLPLVFQKQLIRDKCGFRELGEGFDSGLSIKIKNNVFGVQEPGNIKNMENQAGPIDD